jgi:hypothetical protein
MDFSRGETAQATPRKPGNAVGAPALATLCYLYNTGLPRSYGIHLPVVMLDRIRRDYHRVAHRPDSIQLHRRHAPGHGQVAVGKLRKAPEHPPFGRPDNRAGVDDNRVCFILIADKCRSPVFQDFHEFGRIPEIVPAPIGLDEDPPAKKVFNPGIPVSIVIHYLLPYSLSVSDNCLIAPTCTQHNH